MQTEQPMIETLTLRVPEAEVISWVKQLSPGAKRSVLRALIPEMDRWDALVDYGSQRMRELAAERGSNWDDLSEAERGHLIDTMLHDS